MDIDQLVDCIVDLVHRMDNAADKNEYELFRMQLEFNIKTYQGKTFAGA